ncbi:MAG: YceI family protein [Cyclobacteriaceae bacterium]|nr:YceI family protein [Cyclobacteriaceae bacterium]
MARNGYVRFFSEAPLENIEAVNNEGLSIFESSTNKIAFTIPIKNFEFEKSLMQQHFNENYLESDKYPSSTFKGEIKGFSDTSDQQVLKAHGEMTIHGVTREITVEGQGIKRDDKIILEASFPVKLEDYDIKIPKVVLFNIAEVVDVTIKFEFELYEPN